MTDNDKLVHMKCIACDFETFYDSLWYLDNYDDDKDGWFTCPHCNNDTLSVFEDYITFKSALKEE